MILVQQHKPETITAGILATTGNRQWSPYPVVGPALEGSCDVPSSQSLPGATQAISVTQRYLKVDYGQPKLCRQREIQDKLSNVHLK